MVDSGGFIRPAKHEHPTTNRGGGSRSLHKTKWFLVFAALILLVGMIGATILLLLKNFVSNKPALVVTRIVSASKDLKNTYIISGVTGKPDASQHQVQAHLLSYRLPSQSMAVRVTGLKTIPGIQAAGTLTFYNGSLRQVTIAAGTIFTGIDGVQVVNDELAIIPASKPPTEGSVSVAAHAMNIGTSGNIRALDIHLTCCIADDYIFVENQDEQQIPVVQQSDIDGVVELLTQQAKTSLLLQVRSNERLVNPPQCTSKEISNHTAGDSATSVKVTASVICIGEVYDQLATETLAANLLKSEAIKSLGNGYTLVGKVVTKITQIMVTDTKKGTLLLFVETEGVWVSGHLSFLHYSST